MASSKKRETIEGTLKPGILLALRLVSGVAILLAGYLAWISFTNMNAVGCGPESGCQEVLNSKWAYFMGIPVSLLGLVAYAVLFLGALQLDRGTPVSKQKTIWLLLIPAAVLAAGGALWFTGVQLFIIKKFCPYCMVTHGLALVAGAIVLIKTPFHQAPTKQQKKIKQVYILPKTGFQLGLIALLALVVMGIGQGLSTRKSFVEQSMEQAPQIEMVSSTATNTAPATTSPTPATPVKPEKKPATEYRSLKLYDGTVSINLNDVPLYGKPDAPHVMISMHDYTCKHCRTAHGPLVALHKQFSNELAIVSLPMPLDASCNRIVPRTPKDHVNACQYAMIGLGVWRANPEALEAFENFVFGPPRPPSLEETRAFAWDLVGESTLNQAMMDPWISEQLKTSTALYAVNYQKYRKGSMPQFIIGTNVIFGFPAAEFFQRVTNHFGLITPRP